MRSQDKKVIFSLRVPRDLNEIITKQAKAIGISKNAVILNLLHKALRAEKRD